MRYRSGPLECYAVMQAEQQKSRTQYAQYAVRRTFHPFKGLTHLRHLTPFDSVRSIGSRPIMAGRGPRGRRSTDMQLMP